MSDLLNYCDELYKTNSSYPEAHKRNIIGRAYYYTYYEAENTLVNRLNWCETSDKGGVHARMISRLKGFHPTSVSDEKKRLAEMIHTRVNSLKKLRTKADYRLELPVSKKLVEFSIAEARGISQMLGSL